MLLLWWWAVMRRWWLLAVVMSWRRLLLPHLVDVDVVVLGRGLLVHGLDLPVRHGLVGCGGALRLHGKKNELNYQSHAFDV